MPKRDDAHMASRRLQIIEAVRQCIDKKGVGAMSISDISEASGLSIGAIYTHFGSKEEILTAMLESDHETRPLFEGCTTAGETLGRMAELLEMFGQRNANGLKSRVSLDIAALARNNAKVMEAVEAGYRGQRKTVLDQAAMLAHGGIDSARAAVIGECLFALLLSAQMQMLAGVSPDTDAKLKAARALIEELHGGPVRLRRLPTEA